MIRTDLSHVTLTYSLPHLLHLFLYLFFIRLFPSEAVEKVSPYNFFGPDERITLQVRKNSIHNALCLLTVLFSTRI